MVNHPENRPQTLETELKDYYCPFCHNKLFRGAVKEFKQVCQECNRLVDSKKLKADPDPKETD